MANLEELTKKSEEMEKQLKELKSEIERAKKWEMKSTYDYDDKYFFIDGEGVVSGSRWNNLDIDINRFSQGNIFATEKEANSESNRRTLLAKFREFRDERNEGWKPDWTDTNEAKWSAVLSKGELKALSVYFNNSFDTFGHFKNQEDCQRAVEIFGEEIIELFVEA
nr:MAG TPA: trimer Lung surfactant protein D coiled-coil trimerization [Caudoviricetes sp.]